MAACFSSLSYRFLLLDFLHHLDEMRKKKEASFVTKREHKYMKS